MTDIIKFYPSNAAENPNNVLEQAIGQYSDVLILGWDKEGYFDARASLGLTQKEILWLIEYFKHNLMSGDYNE